MQDSTSSALPYVAATAAIGVATLAVFLTGAKFLSHRRDAVGELRERVTRACERVAAGCTLKLGVEVLKDLMELGGASGPLAEQYLRFTDQGKGLLKIAEPKTLYFFHKMLFNHQLCSCLPGMKKQEEAMELWETPIVATIRHMDGVIIKQTKSAVVPDVAFGEKDFDSFRNKYKKFPKKILKI